MIPPTSIDGTDITGATIDGTDVTEITVDGDTVFSAGPTSVVSRDPDNSVFSAGSKQGLAIETKTQWPSIGARLSNNTSGASTAYLIDSTGVEIQTVNISGLVGGDAFAFTNVNLSANENYNILIDNNGSSFNIGFASSHSGYPYTTPDIDIVGRGFSDGTFSSSRPLNVNDIGDVGF